VSTDFSKNDKNADEKQISVIFDWARNELEKLESNKKRVICELAARLQGKLADQEIGAEIVHQLKGHVSDRYIHAILPDKYKTRTKPSKNSKKKEEPLSVIVEVGGAESQIASNDVQDKQNEPGVTDLPKHETESTDTSEFKLMSQVEELTLRLKNRDEQIENLKASLEAKAVEDNLAKPRSPVSPPQQMKMDQYFQQFSDLVATARNHNCPAACETWQKASTISLA
jgi:hypothetical protein